MYKEGQVVFNIERKAFGVIEEICTTPKGTLHTVKYVDASDKTEMFRRYYIDRMLIEFVAMKNTDMAYVLFANGKEK